MKKLIIIGDKTFKTQSECEQFSRKILTELGITESVKLKNEEYFKFLILLCKRHPRYVEKFNKFIDFQVYQDILNKRGLALNIINNDGTFTEISWKKCVTGKNNLMKTDFNLALRQCISYQIKEFKDTSDLSYCRECNCSLHNKIINIDHHLTQFKQLVEDFLDVYKETITIPNEYNKKPLTFEKLFKDEDVFIGKLFEQYHLKYATLRVLCETCNLTRDKYKAKT